MENAGILEDASFIRYPSRKSGKSIGRSQILFNGISEHSLFNYKNYSPLVLSPGKSESIVSLKLRYNTVAGPREVRAGSLPTVQWIDRWNCSDSNELTGLELGQTH